MEVKCPDVPAVRVMEPKSMAAEAEARNRLNGLFPHRGRSATTFPAPDGLGKNRFRGVRVGNLVKNATYESSTESVGADEQPIRVEPSLNGHERLRWGLP